MQSIRTQKIVIIYVVVLLIFLFLPILQIAIPVFPPTQLYGIAVPTSSMQFSRPLFIEEKYQKNLESYFVKGNVLWSYALKIGNQFYYTIFSQVSSRLNNSVLVGNNGYFFQSMYLKSLNNTKSINRKKADGGIKRLVELDKMLKSKGKKLIVLVSPNLISLYPDTLPEDYRNIFSKGKESTYDYIAPKLKNSGITFLDSFELLKNVDQINNKRLFQKTGSHLNDLGVCLQINLVMKNISNKDYKDINCNNFDLVAPPLQKDLDLIEIANLFRPEIYFSPSPRVNDQLVGFTDGYKPRMLLVGSSFLFGIQELLERFKLAETSTLYFYNRTVREKSTEKLHPKRKTDWGKELDKYDVVLLEINKNSIGKIGYGFIKEALLSINKPSKNKDLPKK